MTRVLAILLMLVLPLMAEQRQSFVKQHVPSDVLSMTPTGRMSPTNILHATFGLTARNQESMDALTADLYDPSSTNYHQWITPNQFSTKFGSTDADYHSLETFLVSNGWSIVTYTTNRIVIAAEAPASVVEQTLGVEMNVYRHPTEDRDFFSLDREPTIGINVPISNISGLQNYYRPKHSSGSGTGGAYRGYDFRNAYLPNYPLTGTGQVIGIISFYNYFNSDLTTYVNTTGLPALTVTTVGVGPGPFYSASTPQAVEMALDLEVAHAMAPGAILYNFEGSTTSTFDDIFSVIVTYPSIAQISCSYDWITVPEYTDPAGETLLRQMALQGQCFFAASDDAAAYVTGTANHTAAWPGCSINAVSCGGTTLTMNGLGISYASETTWNQGGGVGTGGGVSAVAAIPIWQTGISMTANGGSATMRNVPDVAMTAQNIDVYWNSGWHNQAGTSAATPLWAGLCALINQKAVAAGKPVVGFLNPAIYALGKSAAYTDCFHDITTGNNFWASSPTKYPAVAGYDLCTGWGTPNGTNLINALYTGPTVVSLVFSNGLFIQAK